MGRDRPVRRRTRPRGRVAPGVRSAVLLALLLVGLPLVALPVEGPAAVLRSLAAVADGRIGLDTGSAVLFVVAWTIWIQLAACAIVETRSLVLGSGIPPRVPVATWRQQEFIRFHLGRVALAVGRADAAAPLRPPSHTSPDPLGAVAEHTRRSRAERGTVPHPDLVAAPLLAAGVIDTLDRSRAARLAGRGVGWGVPVPPDHLTVAEAALRLGADRGGVHVLDRVVHWVSWSLAQVGAPPLRLLAVRLSEAAVELRCAVPRHDLPAPFVSDAYGTVWTLARGVDVPDVPDGPHPVPALVTFGDDGTGRVLVDLEAAQGVVLLDGDQEAVRRVLLSVVVELATSARSRDCVLTLVGFGPAAAGLAGDRVRVVDHLVEAWPAVTASLAGSGAVMRRHPGWSAPEVRAPRGQTSDLPPEIIVTASPLSSDDIAAVEPWFLTAPARAPFCVVAPRGSGASGRGDGRGWSVTLDGRGVLDSPSLNHPVGAQALSPGSFAAVAALLRHAGDPLAPDRAVAPAPRGAVDPREVKVLIHLFGHPDSSGDVPPGSPSVVEVAAFLGLRRSATIDELVSAIWPHGIDDADRAEVVRRTTWWLGLDSAGRPRLAVDGDVLRLSDEVQVDWTLVLGHASGAYRLAPPTLVSLLRGRPAPGTSDQGYSWLCREEAAHVVEAATADVCVHVATDLVSRGQGWTATEVALAGLLVTPGVEVLWQVLEDLAPIAQELPHLIRGAS